jgi:hypothetical protein
MRKLGLAAALAAVLALGLRPMAAVAAPDKVAWRDKVFTTNGIVLLGYGEQTDVRLLYYGKDATWTGKIGNQDVTRIPLRGGHYTLEASDEVRVIASDLKAYTAGVAKPAKPAPPKPRDPGGPLRIVPVPWVADPTYASDPPSYASSHVIFMDVPTRCKAVIAGGTPPFSVSWDFGDGSAVATSSTSDADAGGSVYHTYSGLLLNTQLAATVTVTDADSNTATGRYWMVVRDPAVREHRVNRSADEGLWYLHTQISRFEGDAYSDFPVVPEGYIESAGYTYGPTSMAAVAFLNSGRSVTGGRNLSHDAAKDAYVEDVDRLIAFITNGNRTPTTTWGGTITFTSGRTLNPDTHGPGGTPNGLFVVPGSSTYEAAMMLQALCQAGNSLGTIPNRTDYATYYDLIGDFVDGFQMAQGFSGWPEGGWRYGFDYQNDSDGSVCAWAYIGLRAAELAHEITPTPDLVNYPKIAISEVTKREALVWLLYNQAGPAGAYGTYDYRLGAGRGLQQFGGSGYTEAGQWTNAGKSAGALAGLAWIKEEPWASVDTNVNMALSFAYRSFYTPDYSGWSTSARDAYGMYNLFKGLRENGISSLVDPYASAGVDYDGMTHTPIDWYPALLDFLAGTSATNLGHQVWAGNSIMVSPKWSGTTDGHFEPNNACTGDWEYGNADYYSGVNLVTAWDIAIMAGAVFTPAPEAVIRHPDVAAGEDYIPVAVGGVDYYATFDPAGSLSRNTAARVNRVRWDFGDGTTEDYDLPSPSPLGGVVPDAPGIHPAGNQAQHHYATAGDRIVTLTVWDSTGNASSAQVMVHVTPPPFPPVGVLGFRALGGSRQVGDVVGIMPDGTVQLEIDGSRSYNNGIDGVLDPKNPRGISQFWFEWPKNPDSGFNTGLSEVPTLFDQGSDSSDPNLNPGSKEPTQTYTFRFNPAALPGGFSVGLRVMSNLGPSPSVPDTVTIFRQLRLVPNGDLPAEATTLTAPDVSGDIGDTVDIKARLTDAGVAGIAGRSIALSVAGDPTVHNLTTDADGWVSVPFAIPMGFGAGPHAISAAFAGDGPAGRYAAATGSGTLTVETIDTVLVVDDKGGEVGGSVTLTATLTADGSPLAGKTVTFGVPGVGSGSGTTNASGVASCVVGPLPSGSAGPHPINAAFPGDADYSAVSASATLTVAKLATALVALNASGPAGGSADLKATLTGPGGAPLPGKTVAFAVPGVGSGSAVTNASGVATYALLIPAGTGSGDFTINASFAGDADYLPSTSAAALTVSGGATGVPTQTVAVDRAGAITDRTPLLAYLRQPGTFNGYAGRTLSFSIDGGPAMPGGPTNAVGKASALYIVPAGPPTRPISVTFAGDATLAPSSGSATFTVLPKRTTSITIYNTSGTPGRPVTLAGWLYRQHPDGTRDPLASRLVRFRIPALSTVGTTYTNGAGYALITFTIPITGGGTHPWTVEYAGDDLHLGSSASANLACGAPSTRVFLPDRTGAIGTTVLVRAYLLTALSSTPVAGKTLMVSVDGTGIGSGVTDGAGMVALNYLIPDGAGAGLRTTSAAFAGDGAFLASSGTGKLTVTAAPVYIYMGDRTAKVGTSVALKAYVRRLPDLAWQVGKLISYTVAGSPAGSATTDGSGVATLGYAVPAGMAPGAYPIVGSFAGDAALAAGTSAPGTLTVIP